MNIKLLLVQATGNYYLCEESKKQTGLKRGSLKYSWDVAGMMQLSKHFSFFSPLCSCLCFLSYFGGSERVSDKVTILESNLSPFLIFCSIPTMCSFPKRCTYIQFQIHTQNVDSPREICTDWKSKVPWFVHLSSTVKGMGLHCVSTTIFKINEVFPGLWKWNSEVCNKKLETII